MFLIYIAPFIALGSIPAFYFVFGANGPFLTVLLLIAVLVGAEAISPRGHPFTAHRNQKPFRLLPVVYVPLQIALIVWAAQLVAQASFPALGFAALTLSAGITTGVFGMLVAHELVHGAARWPRRVGATMLTFMCYRHFRIAHIHGHHRHAGTLRDASTARYGEGYYTFLLRTVPGQVAEAWRHEERRCAVRALPRWRNRIYGDAAVMAAVFAGFYALWGWRGVLFFVLQSAVGVIVLELFNFIAHYGLTRGSGESFGKRHSWNSSNVLANSIIFNMGRHSDHHRRPAAPYQELRFVDGAPELPAGYAGSILLALAPPLWRRWMDPAVRALQMRATA